MEIDKLIKALDNDANSKIMNMTTQKMNSMKQEILKELQLSADVLQDYLRKLKSYKYVDELEDLDIGRFIRWINIKDPENISLSNGAHICDINDETNTVKYKTFANKHFQLKMDECLIFQKMTGQEEVILYALDHLTK